MKRGTLSKKYNPVQIKRAVAGKGEHRRMIFSKKDIESIKKYDSGMLSYRDAHKQDLRLKKLIKKENI